MSGGTAPDRSQRFQACRQSLSVTSHALIAQLFSNSWIFFPIIDQVRFFRGRQDEGMRLESKIAFS